MERYSIPGTDKEALAFVDIEGKIPAKNGDMVALLRYAGLLWDGSYDHLIQPCAAHRPVFSVVDGNPVVILDGSEVDDGPFMTA